MTALDPIFDTLPEVKVSGVSEPNVISLSLVEAIDTVNGVLVIEEIHAVDEGTEVGLGEYGTFRVRRYDYGLEPRTTTLEIHRGQFAGLVAAWRHRRLRRGVARAVGGAGPERLAPFGQDPPQ